MNEVTTTLPMNDATIASTVTPEMTEVQEHPKADNMPSVVPEEMPNIPEEGLERTPDADSVELGANCANLKALKAPSPQQVVEGLGMATTIAIALKSFIQSLGDLWHTTKDNFHINKEKAVAKQLQKNNATKMDVAA